MAASEVSDGTDLSELPRPPNHRRSESLHALTVMALRLGRFDAALLDSAITLADGPLLDHSRSRYGSPLFAVVDILARRSIDHAVDVVERAVRWNRHDTAAPLLEEVHDTRGPAAAIEVSERITDDFAAASALWYVAVRDAAVANSAAEDSPLVGAALARARAVERSASRIELRTWALLTIADGAGDERLVAEAALAELALLLQGELRVEIRSDDGPPGRPATSPAGSG